MPSCDVARRPPARPAARRATGGLELVCTCAACRAGSRGRDREVSESADEAVSASQAGASTVAVSEAADEATGRCGQRSALRAAAVTAPKLVRVVASPAGAVSAIRSRIQSRESGQNQSQGSQQQKPAQQQEPTRAAPSMPSTAIELSCKPASQSGTLVPNNRNQNEGTNHYVQ